MHFSLEPLSVSLSLKEIRNEKRDEADWWCLNKSGSGLRKSRDEERSFCD